MTSKMNETFLANLDMLGQQPLFKLYTPLCFFYPFVRDNSDKSKDIPNSLRNGLQKLTAAFPWIAGQVVTDEASGLSKIVSLSSHPIPELKIQDHGSSLPSFAQLANDDFPFSMIDERALCARDSHIENLEDPTAIFPVFVVQLNYIKDGIILGFVTHHQTADMAGMGAVLTLFNKACRGEPFTKADIETGNMRPASIPLLENPDPNAERLQMQITKPAQANHVAAARLPPPANSTWVYFSFSASSLLSLKAAAVSEVRANGAPFVSTDDVLSALIWQSITRARIDHLDPKVESRCLRAVDTRPYLRLPENYTGLMQNETYTPWLPQELISAPLGAVASRLRLDLEPTSLEDDTRALITLMANDSDKGRYSIVCYVNLGKDVMLSSWTKVDAYNMDFGIGVKPTRVKRPRFPPVPGLIFMMPKRLDGEISVAVCLRDEEMAKFRRDEVWYKYSTYVG